jgi:hypothetical protein
MLARDGVNRMTCSARKNINHGTGHGMRAGEGLASPLALACRNQVWKKAMRAGTAMNAATLRI